ncbi:MAG TPA: IS5 family transposase [Mycobacteriales bacterium]|jgi:transposase|nr:IS5 family transposase [Mycobacteriales bacterium]HEX4430400.1 IS5 family transposase [Frankiaceae bacterium]
MRGSTERQMGMLLGVTADELVPADHPIRRIRRLVDHALAELSPTFAQMYKDGGRPSIPPEHLLKGSLLIALYSIRSERQFCERLQYDLLFKWFLDLNIADPAWDASTFSKNRQRLLDQEVARRFFAAVLAEAKKRRLLSADHFTVDGTLLEAWASLKSFVPKDAGKDDDAPPLAGGGKDVAVDFHGETRSNATHASTTDPDARLAKKGAGKEAKLCYLGNVLMENRTGLVVDVETLVASGTGEVDAALTMLDRLGGTQQITIGADKGYDQRRFVDGCRGMAVTPHVAQKQRSATDGRTTRHAGYAVSQRLRKRVEEIFGWEKTVGGLRKLRYRGLEKVAYTFTFTAAAYNLVRMAKLDAA